MRAFAKICILMAAFASPAFGRTIEYGEQTVVVRLPYGSPSIFKFDVAVKTISSASQFEIKPANDEAPDYTLLSVEPRVSGAVSNVVFILADNETLRVRLISGDEKPGADTFFEFSSKQSANTQFMPNQEPQEASKVELMRAMILGDRISGFQVRTVDKTVSTGIAGIETKMVKIYEGPEFNGYVFVFKNATPDKTYTVDIRRLRIGRPNLALLASIDEKTLSPDKSAQLTLIAKPLSFLTPITLPVGFVKKQGE